MHRAFLVAVLTALITPPAASQDRVWPSQSPDIRQKFADTPPPAHECSCRGDGRAFEIGAEMCLDGHIAICDMSENVTIWQLTKRPCPQS